MGFFIPAEREQNLRKYSYSGHDGSLLSKYVLTPYWNNLVKLFPMWYAPNLITLSGLAFVIVNFVTLIYYIPSLACVPKPVHTSLGGVWDPLFIKSEPLKDALQLAGKRVYSLWHGSAFSIADVTCPPKWLFLTWSVSLFIYQSLDAIDGKQARRTGSSSPLGEVFDHGCDAINTTLEVILSAAAMNLGMGWWTVATQGFTLANFFLTTWEEYHTGVLYLSAFSGPVEGILMICVIYLISGIYGPQVWDKGILTMLHADHLSIVKQLHIKNLPLNECFLTFGALGLLFNISGSYSNVYKAMKKKNKSVVTPIFGLLPFVVHSGLVAAWLDGSEFIRTKHLLPFAVFWGFCFAYQVGLLITAHVSKGAFPYHNVLLLYTAIGAIDANLPRWFGKPSYLHATEGQALLFVYWSMFFAFAVYAFFVYDTIDTFCRVLDINCLSIKYYGKKKPASSFEKEPPSTDKKSS